MAAPTPVTRVAPTGIKLKDGFRIVKAFSLYPGLNIWEKTVQIPGIDGGDAIDQVTQHNVAYRTMAPRSLVTLSPHTFKFAYDPGAITDLLSMVNREQTITDLLPDGSTYSYYGFMQKLEFDELQEGTQPEGTATVVPTNFDPANHVEAGPVVVSVAGT